MTPEPKLTIEDIAPSWLRRELEAVKDHDPDCECGNCVALQIALEKDE